MVSEHIEVDEGYFKERLAEAEQAKAPAHVIATIYSQMTTYHLGQALGQLCADKKISRAAVNLEEGQEFKKLLEALSYGKDAPFAALQNLSYHQNGVYTELSEVEQFLTGGLKPLPESHAKTELQRQATEGVKVLRETISQVAQILLMRRHAAIEALMDEPKYARPVKAEIGKALEASLNAVEQMAKEVPKISGPAAARSM